MRRINIVAKLFIATGALIGLLLGASAAGMYAVSVMNGHFDTALETTVPRMELLLRIRERAAALRSEQRRALVAAYAHDAERLTESTRLLAETAATMGQELDRLARLAADPEREAHRAIRERLGEWMRIEAEIETLARAGSAAAAWQTARDRGNPAFDQLAQAIADLHSHQERFLQSARVEGDTSFSVARWLLAGIILASLIAGAIVVHHVRDIAHHLRLVIGQLSVGAQQVVASSAQITAASQSLSQGASDQAASLEESSASMEEMAASTRTNAENSAKAAAMMAETDDCVQGAHQALDEMVASMAEIKQSSGKVANIIRAIDEIAFQTNILALNAAVEAARAGAAGMGFAVVADEVRSLAQRSAQAAQDTAALIEESIGRSNDGERKVQIVTGTMATISTQTAAARAFVDAVSEATRQQADGIAQVSKAIAQMEKVTQRTAATAEESAAASESLNSQAGVSMQVAARLMRMVGNRAGAPGSPAAPVSPAAGPGARTGTTDSRAA